MKRRISVLLLAGMLLLLTACGRRGTSSCPYWGSYWECLL